MPVVKLTYWQRLRNALTGTPDPQPVFGFEDAWNVLTAPNMKKYEDAGGEIAEVIATTQVATVVGFTGAKVTVAEEAEGYAQAQSEQIEVAEADNKMLQADLDKRIAALKEAKVVLNEETQQTVATCVGEVQRAARVLNFFAPVLK